MKRLDYPGTVEALYTRPQLTHAIHGGSSRPLHHITRPGYSTRDGITRDPARMRARKSTVTAPYDYDAHYRALAGESAPGPTLDEQRREARATASAVVLLWLAGLTGLGAMLLAVSWLVRTIWS